MTKNKTKTVDNCNLCGICNLNCPIYKVILKESSGARFKAFLGKKKELRDVFYLCTECGSCIQDCPANIQVECLKARAELVKKGVETPANKVLRDNIKQYGNPFGELKKGKKIEQYYT